MENKPNTQESGFKLKNVYLISDNFKREINIPNIEKLDYNMLVDIKTSVDEDRTSVSVEEELSLISKSDDKEVIRAEMKMLAQFEIIGDAPMDLEYFGNVNGAAILFPFVREHLASKCLKAGIGNLLIPPVNFVQRYQRMKEEENNPIKDGI